jgi:AcrR family transcriptional regulator
MSTTTSALKRDTRKAQTRQALIEAASELFARQGIDATSIDEIAASVGLTKGAVYAHFGSKAGLVDVVMDGASANVSGQPLTDPSLPFAESLTAMGREAAAQMQRLPRSLVMLNLEYVLYLLRNPQRRRKMREEFRRNRAVAATALDEAARERGEDLLVSGEQLAALLEAVGPGLAIAQALDRTSLSEETVEKFFAALSYALTHPEPVNALLSTRPNT